MKTEPVVQFITDTILCNGLGAAAQGLMIAADAAQLPYQVRHVRTPSPQHDARAAFTSQRSCCAGSPNINLLALNPQGLAAMPLSALLQCVGSRPTVAAWHWELPVVPPSWRVQSQWLDEAWAPSTFVHEAFLAGLDCPISIVPPAITPPVAPAPLALPIESDAFVFLTAFNPASCAQRKNPFGVIDAFAQFMHVLPQAAVAKARLIIKTQSLARYPAVARALEAAAQSVNAIILDAQMTAAQRSALWQRAGAFVSLHRSEGFGLGIAEALAAGVPVIATAHSGNLDFCSAATSWQVDCTLRPISAHDHALQPEFGEQYTVGQTWAEPDVAQAASHMLAVHEGGEAIRQRAEAGWRFITQHYSPAAVGARMAGRLAHVLSTNTTPASMRRRALICARRDLLSQHPRSRLTGRLAQHCKRMGLTLLARLVQ